MTVSTSACCCSRFNSDQSLLVPSASENLWDEPADQPHSCPYLSELDGEDGMRPATDVIHPSRCCGAKDISCIHKFFYVTVVLY